MQRLPTIQLSEFETVATLPLQTRTPDTYFRMIAVSGNSILSSVFIESMDHGASLFVRYWDTTTGTETTEEYVLGQHRVLTIADLGPKGITDRETFTKIHDKTFQEVVVTGGNVRFGIYCTVVSSFATDLDAALQHENELVSTVLDKGLPIVVYEEDDGVWQFLRSTGGRLQVDVPNGIQVTQVIPNRRLYDRKPALTPGIPTVQLTYTVPVGKQFYWIAGSATASTWCKWKVEIDGTIYLSKRNAFDEPNIALSIDAPLLLSAGQAIIVTVENLSPYNNTADCEVFLFGREETV
jgi:hypothetical protein